MTIHEEIARRIIAARWEDDIAFGVVETALRRPGRGRSEHGSNKRGWRYEKRLAELEKFNAFVGELIGRLELGTLTAEAARQRIDEAAYADFACVAESMDHMIALFADYLRAGDNVWSEGWTPAGGPGNRVFRLRSWYDRSHPRIV
jgi:hypothetical protein